MDHRGKTGYSFNWTIKNLNNTQPIFFKVVILMKWSFLILLQGFSFAIYQAGARPCHSSNLHVLFVYAVINFTVGSILWYFVGYSLSFGPSQNVRLCWNPLTNFLSSLDHKYHKEASIFLHFTVRKFSLNLKTALILFWKFHLSAF